MHPECERTQLWGHSLAEIRTTQDEAKFSGDYEVMRNFMGIWRSRIACKILTGLLQAVCSVVVLSIQLIILVWQPGTDYFLKKHSNQRGGFGDAVMRVRNASIVKMVNIGRRSDHQVSMARRVFRIHL